MLRDRKSYLILTSTVLLLTTILIAQRHPPVFYFGGKRIFVGMDRAEALANLQVCCKLSPESLKNEQAAADQGRMLGQFIVSKDESFERILGSIYFSHGKVTNVTRPLGEDAYEPWNANAVGFARTLYRALASSSGDSDATLTLSIRHERAKNAETEVLSLTFRDGRGIRMSLIKLDKPLADAPFETRDQVNLEEFLEPSPFGQGR